MEKVDKFIIKWRKENNTNDAIYAAYHLDAMIAYAEQETKELKECLKISMFIDKGDKITDKFMSRVEKALNKD